jgi:dTDP-4-dehydrorhamnose reductase
MSTISVLGAGGMVGAGIVDYFASRGFDVIEINRQRRPFWKTSDHIYFDAMESSAEDLISKLPARTTLINCAGLIKHKIDETNPRSISEAIKVNTVLPITLAHACADRSILIYQVATDCVYSGRTGNYSETSVLDPQDLYGLTKAAGEVESENTMTLRCSLIGRERENHLEFLDWVLSHHKGGEIDGYENHYWNGVTVLDVAKLLEGLIAKNFHRPGTHHFTPSNSVSKYELIKLVCAEFGRQDLKVNKVNALVGVNRILSTNNPQLNQKMWEYAQYTYVPAISDLISGYAKWLHQD